VKKAKTKKKKKPEEKTFSFIVLNHNTGKFEIVDSGLEAGVHIERMSSHQTDGETELKTYLDHIAVYQVSEENRIGFSTDLSVMADVTVELNEDL
jgi:hypothetical protein